MKELRHERNRKIFPEKKKKKTEEEGQTNLIPSDLKNLILWIDTRFWVSGKG